MGPETKDLVMTLRTAREDLGLSIGEVMEMLKKYSEDTGTIPPSPTSVRSVLNGDLEKISGFSMATLAPLRAVLIHGNAGTPEDRINALLDVIRLQEETIDHLTAQLKALEDTQQSRCKKCEADMDFLKKQIAIKDRRMERKDAWIAELLKLPATDDVEEAVAP